MLVALFSGGKSRTVFESGAGRRRRKVPDKRGGSNAHEASVSDEVTG
jgi:hypothetical protein